MGWKETLKEVLSLPHEARVLSVYEYSVPKGDKTHTYLRCEFVLGGRKRTKHIPRHMEGIVKKLLRAKEKEEALKILDNIYYQTQQLKRLSLDEDLKDQLRSIAQEIMKIVEEDNGQV